MVTLRAVVADVALAAALVVGFAQPYAIVTSAQRGAVERRTATANTTTPPADSGLDGTWNLSTLTALERPAECAGRPTMSAADAAKFEKDLMVRNNADRRDGPADTD